MKNPLIKTKHLARRIYHHYRRPTTIESVASGEAQAAQGCKRARLERIAPYLICPVCGAELNRAKSRCKGGHSYSHSESYYNFLTAAYQHEFKIVTTDNVAANEYDEIATGIIKETREGLILDCGAGRHTREYPNVIFYEVVTYPSTDVLGVGESLPFQDETFDAVFSLNVLEHVADPFRCAGEISRVLKKGGKLYCVAPFLAPLHSYPNHFYNMTVQGLQHLFEESFEILKHEVPPSGVPIWALNWILRSWADGLAGKTKDDFLNMSVKDLTEADPLDYLQRDFVKELSAEKNSELACTNMLIGKKI